MKPANDTRVKRGARINETRRSGSIVGAGGGFFHAAYVTHTQGVALPQDQRNAEGVAAVWDQIIARTDEFVPQSGAEQGMQAMKKLQGLAG